MSLTDAGILDPLSYCTYQIMYMQTDIHVNLDSNKFSYLIISRDKHYSYMIVTNYLLNGYDIHNKNHLILYTLY